MCCSKHMSFYNDASYAARSAFFVKFENVIKVQKRAQSNQNKLRLRLSKYLEKIRQKKIGQISILECEFLVTTTCVHHLCRWQHNPKIGYLPSRPQMRRHLSSLRLRLHETISAQQLHACAKLYRVDAA